MVITSLSSLPQFHFFLLQREKTVRTQDLATAQKKQKRRAIILLRAALLPRRAKDEPAPPRRLLRMLPPIPPRSVALRGARLHARRRATTHKPRPEQRRRRWPPLRHTTSASHRCAPLRRPAGATAHRCRVPHLLGVHLLGAHVAHVLLARVQRHVRGDVRVHAPAVRPAEGVRLCRPHLHGDLPAGLDRGTPDFFKDQLALRALEVVVPFSDMRADVLDVHEGLDNEAFHGLLGLVVNKGDAL